MVFTFDQHPGIAGVCRLAILPIHFAAAPITERPVAFERPRPSLLHLICVVYAARVVSSCLTTGACASTLWLGIKLLG